MAFGARLGGWRSRSRQMHAVISGTWSAVDHRGAATNRHIAPSRRPIRPRPISRPGPCVGERGSAAAGVLADGEPATGDARIDGELGARQDECNAARGSAAQRPEGNPVAIETSSRRYRRAKVQATSVLDCVRRSTCRRMNRAFPPRRERQAARRSPACSGAAAAVWRARKASPFSGACSRARVSRRTSRPGQARPWPGDRDRREHQRNEP